MGKGSGTCAIRSSIPSMETACKDKVETVQEIDPVTKYSRKIKNMAKTVYQCLFNGGCQPTRS
jgi:hypothetical protein